MSCMTVERRLASKRAYAIKSGWGWLPDYVAVDAECPYCGAELSIEYDYEGCDDTEDECPACGREFDLYIEWEPVYTCRAKGER